MGGVTAAVLREWFTTFMGAWLKACLVMALFLAVALPIDRGSPAIAHDDIKSSSPQNGEVLSDSIDRVTIDFGEAISDSVQMFLRYESTGGEVVQIDGEVVLTGPTTARLNFDLLEKEGTYFVNYLGLVPSDGHVIAGAIGFIYGAPSAQVSDDPNVLLSKPFARESLAKPISRATVEFAAPVANVRFFMVYDEGDSETFTPIDLTQEQVTDEKVIVNFEELNQDGTYILSYLARYAADDEEISGNIPFFLGTPTGEQNPSYNWFPFLLLAMLILTVGGLVSWRRIVRGRADDELGEYEDSADIDDDLADVRV